MKSLFCKPETFPSPIECVFTRDRICKANQYLRSNTSQVTTPAYAIESTDTFNERTCQGGGESSRSASSKFAGEESSGTGKAAQGRPERHRRSRENDESQNNGDGRNPKRPCFSSPPPTQDDNDKFACPYRKHDTRKYCVQHWGPCALTPLDTIARVK